jgi:hypothetical protein
MMRKMRNADARTVSPGNARALQALVAAMVTGEPRRHEIRRDGLSPIVFEGHLLAEATSRIPSSRIWYDIAAYARMDGGFVMGMQVCRQGGGERDILWARQFPTVTDLSVYLETHDPARDVMPADDLTDGKIATAEAMIRAVGLRQRIDEARRAYQSVVGDLLTELATFEETAVDQSQSASLPMGSRGSAEPKA